MRNHGLDRLGVGPNNNRLSLALWNRELPLIHAGIGAAGVRMMLGEELPMDAAMDGSVQMRPGPGHTG